MSFLSKFAIRLIERYQENGGGEKLLLVDCNFIPSCSEYAKQTFDRFGFWQGVCLSVKRILRCNKADLIQKIYDPIPERLKEESMLSQERVEQEDEDLRQEVLQMSDVHRKNFYQTVNKKIKDPDTYAVLNWFFLLGLHHFYLGKLVRGVINIVIYLGGFFCILIGFSSSLSGITVFGILMVIGISAIDLIALFRSQIIVQDYNNEITRKILDKLKIRGNRA